MRVGNHRSAFFWAATVMLIGESQSKATCCDDRAGDLRLIDAGAPGER